MPNYDFECQECGRVDEHFFHMDECPDHVLCEECGSTARKIITPGYGGYLRQEAPWLQSVTEVVDRDGGEHCQRFIQEPTRDNYHAWMKKEGIRPKEDGERVQRESKEARLDKLTDKVLAQHQEKKRIELHA